MHLYISTYGSYLHIKDDMFEVKYYEDDEPVKKKVAAHKVSSIVLDKGTSLSWAAIKKALSHNIDIVFAEGDGAPLGRVWHSKLGSTTRIRKRQLQASMEPAAIGYVASWITRKMDRQIDLLKDLKRHRKAKAESIESVIVTIEGLKQKVDRTEGDHISDVAGTFRGLEGTAGRLYFGLLSDLLSSEYRFNGRSRRPAEDAFNAFLNYGYGILYSKIEHCIMIAGLDPYVGFLHRDDYNQTSFVFDFIEPYRPFVDLTIYRLFSGKKVNQSHYRDITNGVGLQQDGKNMIVTAFINRFEEQKIRYKGRNQTRLNTIQQAAHTFANQLIAE